MAKFLTDNLNNYADTLKTCQQLLEKHPWSGEAGAELFWKHRQRLTELILEFTYAKSMDDLLGDMNTSIENMEK